MCPWLGARLDKRQHGLRPAAEARHIVGDTYKEKTKRGDANYREDGSIMFSNETDAYNRMWSSAQEPGGGTNTHEVMGAISEKGVLVLPDYKNNSTTSEIDEYGYKFSEGKLYDPVTKSRTEILGTIHTHQLELDSGPSASPSKEDLVKFPRETPNKPFITMGWDGKLHAARGNKAGFNFIDLPKGYSTIKDILNGASLRSLLMKNKK